MLYFNYTFKPVHSEFNALNCTPLNWPHEVFELASHDPQSLVQLLSDDSNSLIMIIRLQQCSSPWPVLHFDSVFIERRKLKRRVLWALTSGPCSHWWVTGQRQKKQQTDPERVSRGSEAAERCIITDLTISWSTKTQSAWTERTDWYWPIRATNFKLHKIYQNQSTNNNYK